MLTKSLDPVLTKYLRDPTPKSRQIIDSIEAFPDKFDWRNGHRVKGNERTPNDWKSRSIGPVMDQGSCGSCWAVAATGIITDYFRLFSPELEYYDLILSPTSLLNQNINWDAITYEDIDGTTKGIHPAPTGCFGESSDIDNPGAAFLYAQQIGLYSLCIDHKRTNCESYDFTHCCSSSSTCQLIIDEMKMYPSEVVGVKTNDLSCSECMLDGTSCDDISGRVGNRGKLYKLPDGVSIVGVHASNPASTENYIRQLKHAVSNFGPVLVSAYMPSDFDVAGGHMASIGSVYKPLNGQSTIGGHAMALLGWDKTSTGQEYFIFRNSWGTFWGDNGYIHWDAQSFSNGFVRIANSESKRSCPGLSKYFRDVSDCECVDGNTTTKCFSPYIISFAWIDPHTTKLIAYARDVPRIVEHNQIRVIFFWSIILTLLTLCVGRLAFS